MPILLMLSLLLLLLPLLLLLLPLRNETQHAACLMDVAVKTSKMARTQVASAGCMQVIPWVRALPCC
jgi:hypothetical protein